MKSLKCIVRLYTSSPIEVAPEDRQWFFLISAAKTDLTFTSGDILCRVHVQAPTWTKGTAIQVRKRLACVYNVQRPLRFVHVVPLRFGYERIKKEEHEQEFWKRLNRCLSEKPGRTPRCKENEP